MPVDDTLPQSRLPPRPDLHEVLRYFPDTFGIRVDTEGLGALLAPDRQRLTTARPPELPEAVLLDRVLQIVPLRLLHPIERIVLLPTRGVARYGGYLNGIVRVNASDADTRRPDPEVGGRFSFFTTTVLHEIRHAVYQTALTPAQRDGVLDRYIKTLVARGDIPPGEPSQQGTEHFFIEYFVPALLGHGRPPYSAAASRRMLAGLGVELG